MCAKSIYCTKPKLQMLSLLSSKMTKNPIFNKLNFLFLKVQSKMPRSFPPSQAHELPLCHAEQMNTTRKSANLAVSVSETQPTAQNPIFTTASIFIKRYALFRAYRMGRLFIPAPTLDRNCCETVTPN